MTDTFRGVMTGAYVDPDGRLVLRELPIPAVDRDSALVRTLVSTVCGSDLHRFRGADSYGVDTDVFGHESVGEIVRCDSGRFAVGQRVLHAPLPEEGRVFAPYQRARLRQLIALPDGIEPARAVFAQQLGTVVFALDRYIGRDSPRSAFITGAGPAGLLFLQLLRLRGCEEVSVDEPDPRRRALAERLGALTSSPPTGADLAVETSGTPSGQRECADRVRDGGTVGLFGLPDLEPGGIVVPVLELLRRNLSVIGANGAQREPGLAAFRTAIGLIDSGDIEVDALVSHRGRIEDLGRLCRSAAEVADGAVKVLVDFGQQTTASTHEHERSVNA